jgi:hypothetical protein
MSLVSLSLVVLAAFIHATWNLLSKRAADAGPTFVFAYNLFACLVYLPWMIWLLVYGDLHWNLPGRGCLVLSAAFIWPTAFACSAAIRSPTSRWSIRSRAAPGRCCPRSARSSCCARRRPRRASLGCSPVVAGIGLITTQGDLSAFRRPRGLDGVRWGTATGSLIAGYTVVDGYSVKLLGIHPVVLDWVTNLLRFFIMLPIVLSNVPRAREKMKGYWWLAFGVGALSPLSYILVLTAIEMGRPAQPGRTRARNVDDGGRHVRHADSWRTRHSVARGGLRDFDRGRGAAGIGEGVRA